MPRTTRPVWRADGPTVSHGRPESQPSGSARTGATVIHGIVIGCVSAAPFWLVVLAFTFG